MPFSLLVKIAPTADLNMVQTFGVIIVGLAVVFIVLTILVFFVQLLGSFFDKKKKKSNSEQMSANIETKKPEIVKPLPSIADTPSAVQCDEDEVIAVISAVIAKMSEEDGKQYKIKSVKARNSKSYGRPVWASEGLRQNTNPF